jgi:hypothetical protein
VEVHGQDAATSAAVNFALALPGAPDLIDVNGLISLTLIGDFDQDMLMKLRNFIIRRWRAVELDELDGFTSP